MRKGKDPDPDLLLMDPDPGRPKTCSGPKTCGSPTLISRKFDPAILISALRLHFLLALILY
jgi:hypothetical protein